jgi:hypothetical protein
VVGSVDRRKHHRFFASLEVRVLPGEGIPADLQLLTTNIALGGARCASNHPLKVGTRLKMTFTLVGVGLQKPQPIDVDAEVLRSSERSGTPAHRRHEIALTFTRLEGGDRRTLESWLYCL